MKEQIYSCRVLMYQLRQICEKDAGDADGHPDISPTATQVVVTYVIFNCHARHCITLLNAGVDPKCETAINRFPSKISHGHFLILHRLLVNFMLFP